MQVSNKQAISVLDRLDNADDHGKTLWVTGGVAKLLETKKLMDNLSQADKSEAGVIVDKDHYLFVMERLEQRETSVS